MAKVIPVIVIIIKTVGISVIVGQTAGLSGEGDIELGVISVRDEGVVS